MPKKRNFMGESLEDYTEAIYELEKKNGLARVTDISNRLSVSKPSVTEALSILKEKGIIIYSPYKPINLTPKGKSLAKKIKKKHDILRDFLEKILKVESEKAKIYACKMEHILEKEMVDRLYILAKKLFNSQFYKNFEKDLKMTGKKNG